MDIMETPNISEKKDLTKVKYPLFMSTLRKLIARQRISGSAFARKLNIHPLTVVQWTNGRKLPKKFLRDILRDMFGDQITFDDEL